MRFASLGSLALAALLGACSTTAPELPQDTTSVNRSATVRLSDFPPADQALSCSDIQMERQSIQRDMAQARDAIQHTRAKNQAAVYFSMFFIGTLAATDNHEAEKHLLETAQVRNDTLLKLGHVKGCNQG